MSVKLDLEMNKVIAECLGDMKVELTDEFKQNFNRQAFFSEKWKRRRYDPDPERAILFKTGALQKSILSKVEGRSLVFTSSMPYSKIHNEGGLITVTQRMKNYFWHKYKEETKKAKGKKKTKNAKGKELSAEASFYFNMAKKRRGSTIKIPRRMFIGQSPEVEQIVREIAEDCLGEYFKTVKFLFK